MMNPKTLLSGLSRVFRRGNFGHGVKGWFGDLEIGKEWDWIDKHAADLRNYWEKKFKEMNNEGIDKK